MHGRMRNIGFALLVVLATMEVNGFSPGGKGIHSGRMRRSGHFSGHYYPLRRGSAEAEASAMKALRWLKATQNEDGTWGMKPELGLTCPVDDMVAGVGLATLAFLAHGETPGRSKEFGLTVHRALDYLVNGIYIVKDANGKEVADPNGRTPYVRMKGTGDTEYGLLIAAYALCEAYLQTKDKSLRDAAELTLGRIIGGQTATGGWNNNMVHHVQGASDDLFLGGWAIQALRAAAMAGIRSPGMRACAERAASCLQRRNFSEKSGFTRYACADSADGDDDFAGVGGLGLQLLGHGGDPAVAHALDVMRNWTPTSGTRRAVGCLGDAYYSYYATQCKYQAGMRSNATKAELGICKEWFITMRMSFAQSIVSVTDESGRLILVKDAVGNDQPIGYWKKEGQKGCGVMDTSLMALHLMVNYRYLATTSLKAAKPDDEDSVVEVLSPDPPSR